MFGSRIDYMLLRTLAHDANIASESDLNEDDTNPVVLESRLGGGQQRLERLRRVFGSGFPIDPDLRYLDVGCGEGEMPAALALAGCTSVTGVEIVRPDGAKDRIGCDRLILACNGFGGNAAKVARLTPAIADAVYFGVDD